eukprot:4564385-Pyramimonas_sp.AAC.1
MPPGLQGALARRLRSWSESVLVLGQSTYPSCAGPVSPPTSPSTVVLCRRRRRHTEVFMCSFSAAACASTTARSPSRRNGASRRRRRAEAVELRGETDPSEGAGEVEKGE